MRLLEAIIDANHRAIAGDAEAGVHPRDFQDSLPITALTCIDPRLNALFPNVLGLPGDQFIWLRNAGNIITGPTSSTVRSLALACAVKNGREIAIIGHSDCQVTKTTTLQLLEWFHKMGIERNLLPENLSEFFGMFGSEQQNVIKGCEILRRSPVISPKVPVHGLMVDVDTGKLDWIVNGYQNWDSTGSQWKELVQSAEHGVDALKSLADFKIGDMKFPDTKIGHAIGEAEDWLSQAAAKARIAGAEAQQIGSKVSSAAELAEKMIEEVKETPPPPAQQAQPPKTPYPPRPQMRMRMRKDGRS